MLLDGIGPSRYVTLYTKPLNTFGPLAEPLYSAAWVVPVLCKTAGYLVQ
jgi:hypothetical protein